LFEDPQFQSRHRRGTFFGKRNPPFFFSREPP